MAVVRSAIRMTFGFVGSHATQWCRGVISEERIDKPRLRLVTRARSGVLMVDVM